ncbi:MAG: 1-deoxy-D-xylulose-5-phosphate reductoisomerase, partial [Actinobacteria bacterium]|nr:1-deoxy-D-xylulose-5-phosphate reductoisomerase [Actinomycetota bacterium]
MSIRRVIVLGSTGSIGTQALDIIRSNPDQFQLVGISAGGANVDLLATQAVEFNVKFVAVSQGTAVADLQLSIYAHAQANGYPQGQYPLPAILAGPQAATELAQVECDVVLNGITGAVGLMPTVAALKA